MREILFRGKRADNGEWVEGNYILQNDDNPERENYMKPYIKLRNYVNKYEVIPETVGQYTGLTDKNGKKIFEGDILASEWGYKGEVGLYSIAYAFIECLFNEECEIIGNIHGNKELIK